MKLSDAIRLGAMLKPQQYFGGYYDRDRTSSCALGAACDAIGIDPDYERDYEYFPVMRDLLDVDCPECGSSRPVELGNGGIFCTGLIPHLNDKHHWTRERIADFVEQFEVEQPVTQPELEAVEAQ